MQGNYEPNTGYQGVSQNYADYELIDVLSEKTCTFLYKHKIYGYTVIGKWINGMFVARNASEI